MIYIAHRGNINGPNPKEENHPDYILKAVRAGFQVEVDVWFEDGNYILGHDEPQYQVHKSFLNNSKFWCHAKNIPALHQMRDKGNLINCFFHDVDACVLTSQGWIWTYPGQLVLSSRAIAVMPERVPEWDWKSAGGVCSDYPLKY
jgi:hypothetical protein